MRPHLPIASLLLLAGLSACQRGGEPVPSDVVKVSATAPASEAPEAPAAPAFSSTPKPDTKRCVSECVRSRQMEAVGIEVIEASCQKACAEPLAR